VTSPAIEGSDDVQQYQLTLMTQVVQLAAGRNWRPPAVTTSMRDGRLLARTDMFADARLYRHRVRAGIFVPGEVLVRPIRIGSGTEQPMLAAPLPDDFLSSMRSMLRAYLYDARPGISFAVELTGMSERTLQRRLAQHGLNYTMLLDQVRFELAREQLSDSDSKITDIAYDLGFSDVAHFSRAFHRWSGVSPRKFRQLSP